MKNLLVSSCTFMLFLASCSPNEPGYIPTSLSPISLTPTFSPKIKVTSTPVTGTPTIPAPPTIEPTATSTLPPPNIQEAQIRSVTMKDELSGWAWAWDKASVAYLLHTSDGGLSWKNVTPGEYMGLTYFLTGQSAWVAIFDRSTGRSSGLIHTTDGGISWMTVNQDMQKIDAFPYSSSFGFEDENNGWWKTATIGAGTARIYSFRTNDAGMTWEKLIINVSKAMSENYYVGSDGYGEVKICNICGAFFYLDLSRVIFAPGQWSPTTFFLTTDLGTTWKQIELTGLPDDVDPESSPIRYPTFFNDQEGVLPVIIRSQDLETSQIYIYGTQDGGLTWELESGPTTVDNKKYGGTDTVFISRLNGFLNSENGLSVTHDGGNTWTFVAWPPGFKSTDKVFIEPQLNFVSPSVGWAVLRKISRSRESPTESIFLKTIDGGLSWVEILPVFNP